MNKNRKILLVDNRDSFTYNLVQLLEELNAVVMVSADPKTSLSLSETVSHILFSPGPGLPNEFTVMFEILQSRKKNTKILGICLGHQAIAEFYGASLFKQETVQHGQKKKINNLYKKDTSVISQMPSKFNVGLYHSWAVDENSIPESLEITCKTEEGVIMGLIHNEYPVEGIQFHPESFLTANGAHILKSWLEL
jgi:anthranilate synthase/aminodeoxychorismate synthase-like glutamine amidotransferase